MEELDFSKIFGETATSKASFTNENYINGWGYLGSTPPPYQLFDYLQGLNDKKSKYLYDGLNESKNNLLAHNTDSSAHTAILNAIKAISGMSAYDIAPSKTIATIIPLLGFGGIVAQKLEANGYIKFANGLIIQWGTMIFVSNSFFKATFPLAYTNWSRTIISNSDWQDNGTDVFTCNNAGRINGVTVNRLIEVFGFKMLNGGYSKAGEIFYISVGI